MPHDFVMKQRYLHNQNNKRFSLPNFSSLLLNIYSVHFITTLPINKMSYVKWRIVCCLTKIIDFIHQQKNNRIML